MSEDPADPDAAPAGPKALAAEVVRLRAEVARLTRRLAEVELLADRDPLAPVLNRRAFLRELQRTLAYCERYGAAAALVFFDMDGFKAINDQYGHAAGDAALRAVAETLARHVRESDLVGRLGGDEFAVVLAQVDAEAALAKARQLQLLVEAEPLVLGDRQVSLRLSFGVRSFEPGLEAARMLAEADAAMFLHKGERRG